MEMCFLRRGHFRKRVYQKITLRNLSPIPTPQNFLYSRFTKSNESEMTQMQKWEKAKEIWKNNDTILRPRKYSQNRNKIYIF